MEISSQKIHYVWIDHIKFICLFLVVLYHSPFLEKYEWEESLWLFRMPCFFLISGLLFRFDKYPSFVGFAKHRAKQILVPYFSFFLIAYIPWLFGASRFYLSADIHETVPFYLPLLECLSGRPYLILRPLWFLACLFSLQCIFYVIFKNINNKYLALLLLLLFPLVRTKFNLWNLPWRIDLVCLFMPYYGIGYLFKDRIFDFLNRKRSYIPIIIFLGVHLLFLWLFKNTLDKFAHVYFRFISACAIIMVGLIIGKQLSSLMGEKRFIRYISMNAVVVLAWHSYMFRLIQYMIKYLTGSSNYFLQLNFISNLFLTMLVIILLFIPIYLINRYIPFILGKGKYFDYKVLKK